MKIRYLYIEYSLLFIEYSTPPYRKFDRFQGTFLSQQRTFFEFERTFLSEKRKFYLQVTQGLFLCLQGMKSHRKQVFDTGKPNRI